MNAIHRLDSTDEGKRVVTTNGDVIGEITRIHDGDAYVAPRSGLVCGLGSWIACPWDETEQFVLDRDRIARVADEEIVLDVDELSFRPVQQSP